MKTDPQVTIKLDYPVQLADRKLEEITMRRPTMREQLDFPLDDKTDFALEIRLYSRLTDLLPEDIYMFDMGDYEKLQKQFMLFRAPEGSVGEKKRN